MRASSLTAVSTPAGLRRSKRVILVLDREHGIYRDPWSPPTQAGPGAEIFEKSIADSFPRTLISTHTQALIGLLQVRAICSSICIEATNARDTSVQPTYGLRA